MVPGEGPLPTAGNNSSPVIHPYDWPKGSFPMAPEIPAVDNPNCPQPWTGPMPPLLSTKAGQAALLPRLGVWRCFLRMEVTEGGGQRPPLVFRFLPPQHQGRRTVEEGDKNIARSRPANGKDHGHQHRDPTVATVNTVAKMRSTP